MSLNLFPARAFIGTFKDASGRQIGVHASPEFQRALNALRIRVGGDEALSLSDVETLLSFATPPDTETGKAVHDLRVEDMRDHTAEIAELRKTVEELKTQLAVMTDQTAAVAEVKKYAQDLEISYSFVPPLTDWEHPGSIGAKTANAGAFTDLTASGTLTVTGNFGQNVTPSASWWASVRAHEIGRAGNGIFGATGDDEINVGANVINTGSGTYIYGATDTATLYRQVGGQHVWSRAASGSSGAAITFTEVMRTDTSNNFLVGASSASMHTLTKSGLSEGTAMAQIYSGAGGIVVHAASGTGANAAAHVLRVDRNTSTLRSINAAGTVNASGADYAEYMRKSATCGVVAKGQIVGVDVNGELTDKWSESISFLIKSTNPSYVGGDTWGAVEAIGPRPEQPARADNESEEDFAARMSAYESALSTFNANLDAARQKVDRVAFSGQVPVNVMGATPGQYVVPVQDGEGIGAALADMGSITLEQYIIAVGIVQNILPDGRANVRVKVV